MALQTSGQISLNDVNVELGNSGTAQISMGSSAVRGLFGVASGQIRMSDGYGKANEFVLTNEGTINGQSNRKQITVSSFISSGETIKVPSGFWVWSDSTSVPAMIIDIPCTVINEGKIIGKGGAGGVGPDSAQAGGPAVKITSTGVTITNASGSYIAGGGGGGGGHFYGYPQARGGGGAGGGDGADGNVAGTDGAILNASSASGSNNAASAGAGAGGAGGGYMTSSFPGGNNTTYSATGGGRILPGSGGVASNNAANGGSAGNNGSSSEYSGAGGGGWGATGGQGMVYNGYSSTLGGSGGKAIDDSGNSYTLSNSGTVYGAT